jgi:3-oxoacid CoA-transferase
MVQEGGFPIKLAKGGKGVEIASKAKETREFNGRHFVMEESLSGDFALIKGWKADTKGNIVFRKTTRNFNIDAATAGKVCIAEVEQIVHEGELGPDEIHLPGIFVDRVVKGDKYEKRIEKLKTSDEEPTKSKDADVTI